MLYIYYVYLYIYIYIYIYIHIYIYIYTFYFVTYKRFASIGSFFLPTWNKICLWNPALSVICMKFSISGYMESYHPC